MRIISGTFKGRNLISPSIKDEVRPTTDRARESLFNILDNRYNFENKKCVDLFCGTGSFGIEFISRGGKECSFVDLDTRTVEKNIFNLGIEECCNIFKNDALKFLKSVNGHNIEFAFADPPYKYVNHIKILEEISKFPLVFILEHDNNFCLTETYREKLFLHKKIGISQFSFFDFK
jgi:16S rRNA (guanine966-N2)-methyltransferase